MIAGPYGITVTLDTWGPQQDLFTTMYDALQSNWGEEPSRSANQICCDGLAHEEMVRRGDLDHVTGWCRLTMGQRQYVESCFNGNTLPQIREMISFEFTIDGVTRAFTHQNVRTRVGAAFMQHGGRDNDWRHRMWTKPETIRRAAVAFVNKDRRDENGPGTRQVGPDGREVLRHCVQDWDPLDNIVEEYGASDLHDLIAKHLRHARQIYAALVDAGIPWQDARRMLPIGMQTYIHDVYNYEALQGMLSKRLEHVMDWEINCVAQLMLREVRMKCHPLIGKYLRSMSDRLGRAAMAGLESWPPDRKYPSPYDNCECCGHSLSNHYKTADCPDDEMVCQVCERDGAFGMERHGPMHKAVPVDRLERQHIPEQMPFFVLHPDSMAGGQIQWIHTNGSYPGAREMDPWRP